MSSMNKVTCSIVSLLLLFSLQAWDVLAMPSSGRGSIRYNSTRGLPPPRGMFHRHDAQALSNANAPGVDGISSDGGNAELGQRIAVLPLDHETAEVNGKLYHFSGGVFFVEESGAYLVVTPPEGAVVSTVARGCEELVHESIDYHYCGGGFYTRFGDGYRVSTAPVGAIVHAIPEGSPSLEVNGVAHYSYGRTWFRPFFHQGKVIYKVVPPV